MATLATHHDTPEPSAGDALLPIFGGATILAIVAICLMLAYPSVATVAAALGTVIGFAGALVAVLSRLIGPEGPH